MLNNEVDCGDDDYRHYQPRCRRFCRLNRCCRHHRHHITIIVIITINTVLMMIKNAFEKKVILVTIAVLYAFIQ